MVSNQDMRVSRLFVTLAMAAFARGQSIDVRGRVVDESFRPLAGAAVSVALHDALDTAATLATPSTTADADGAFRLRVELSRSDAWMLVTAPERAGLRIALAAVREAPPGVLDVGELPLPMGALRIGRVVGADGTPIAAARIDVIDAIGNGEAFPGEPGRSGQYAVLARTDARGVFRLPGVVPGMKAEISADGHATQQVANLGPSSPTTIELVPTGHVAGRVVDGVGERPLTASVRFEFHGEGLGEAQSTAGDGRFRRSLSSTTRYRVHVHVPGYHRFTGDWLDAPRDDLVVTLQRGEVRPVPVRAKDAVTGEAIRAFQATVVWLANASAAWPRLCEALDKGDGEASNDAGEATLRFPVPDMPPQVEPYVGVRASGYAMAIHRNIDANPIVELERAAAIEGVVRDATTAAPLPGVQVWAFPILHTAPDLTDGWPQPPGIVHTDAQGTFRLEGLQPGELIVHARHPRRPTVYQDVEVAPGQTARVTCSIGTGCQLRVVAKDGALPGAVITLVPRVIAGAAPQLVMGMRDQHLSYQCALLKGEAVFDGLPELVYQVALQLPVACRTGPPITAFFASVKLGAAPTTLELGKLQPVQVDGRLTVHHGDLPMDQLVVIATPSGALLGTGSEVALCRRGFVAVDGRFAVRVAPGTYRLCVVDLRTLFLVHVDEEIVVKESVTRDLVVRPATLVVRPARSKAMRAMLRLLVRRTGSLNGRIGLDGSERAGGARVVPLDPGAEEWRLAVAPGPILLLAFGLDAGTLPPPELFELRAGETTELELPVLGR